MNKPVSKKDAAQASATAAHFFANGLFITPPLPGNVQVGRTVAA